MAGLFDFISQALTNPSGTAVGAISALATKGPAGLLGVFNNQTVKPIANGSGGASFVAVPSNTSGMGIFNAISNLTPLGTLFSQQTKQPVAFSPAVKGGLTSAPASVVSAVKAFGSPLPAGPAQIAQASGLAASGYGVSINSKPLTDNTLLYAGGAILAAKLLRLF